MITVHISLGYKGVLLECQIESDLLGAADLAAGDSSLGCGHHPRKLPVIE